MAAITGSRKLIRPAEMLLGMVFLVAGVLKALDVNLFIAQIYAYQLIDKQSRLIFVALLALTLESILGVAMIAGTTHRRLVLLLVSGMLVFFSGVIAYAWWVHGLEDCGCFGSVPMSPPVAIAKNLVLLMLALAVLRASVREDGLSPKRAKTGLVAAFCAGIVLCGIAAPQLLGSHVPRTTEMTVAGDAPSVQGPFSQYTVANETGKPFALGQGDYLVAMLSMTCDHCMASVPQLNEFMDMLPEVPVVALCWEPSEGSMEEFSLLTGARIPMHSLGDDFLAFATLIGSAPPRLSFVRDGSAAHSWDETMPDLDALLAVLEDFGAMGD